jgi:hypothetical protein
MKKLLSFIAIMSMTLTFAQTLSSKDEKEIDKIYNSSEKRVSTVYNDSKNAVTTVYSDAKSLSPKIESAIKSLASELKTTTNSLWNILVKQQLVWSICFLILTLSSLLNWYLFYKRTQSNPSDITYITLERDIIGEIINPDYNVYYKDRNDDPKGVMYIKGPVGKEQYSCPQSKILLETTFFQKLFKYIHLIICLGLSYLSIIHFAAMLTGFINPEFGALKTIVTVAQSLK